jgi:proteic killer suppression protein
MNGKPHKIVERTLLCLVPFPVTLQIPQLSKKYLLLTLVTSDSSMIISFGNSETEQVWSGNRVKKLPIEIQNIGRRKLRMINNSLDIADLRIPPANRLEKLAGKLKDFYSIRINDQWRIIFKWNAGTASEVEITDYH